MNRQPRTIIVFGLSGVGKSSACLTFVEKNEGWQYIRASSVLRELPKLPWVDQQRFDEFQVFLAKEIKRRYVPDRCRLVDAHSLVEAEVPMVVPTAAVEHMQPTELVFLVQSPEEIRRRRTEDARGRPNLSPPAIEDLQRMALEVCSGYSSALRIPLSVVAAVTKDVLQSVLETKVSLKPSSATPET